MKKTTSSLTVLFLIFFAIGHIAQAQIGIGTMTPEGALDIESSSYGLVYPRVALTSTTSSSPVVNPNGGGLTVGTTVYNTSITSTGSNDVHPGVYSWNGSKWEPQFIKTEYVKFEQSSECQRTTIKQSSSLSYSNGDDISGLTNQVFTPTYSGTYRVEVKTNFGAGKINDFTSMDYLSLATSEGAFFFKMSGSGVDIDPSSSSYDYTEGWSYTHSYAAENDIEGPAVESYNVGHYATLIYYLYLRANNNYTFTLRNCIVTGNNYFVNNGDSGDGQGHIGHYIPCSVEFQYIGE